MSIKNHIPNTLTAGNLFLGCLGIIYVLQGDIMVAAYMMLGAAILDFLDGFVARMLKATSPIGLQLDSLADMVTFGVLPGFVMFYLLKESMSPPYEVLTHLPMIVVLAPAFLISVFSCFRLAKFNVTSDQQTDDFIGLPTPANAIFILGFAILHYQVKTDDLPATGTLLHSIFMITNDMVTDTYFLYGAIVVFSFLLVSPLKMFNLKFKTFGWKGNEIRYIFLLLVLSLVLYIGMASLGFIMLLYVLISIVLNIIKR